MVDSQADGVSEAHGVGSPPHPKHVESAPQLSASLQSFSDSHGSPELPSWQRARGPQMPLRHWGPFSHGSPVAPR
jgi:hypothetical protein